MGNCTFEMMITFIKNLNYFWTNIVHMKIPCEEAVWDVLPKIRATLAWIMVNEFNLKGHAVSDKLGISDAAVSQYLKGKRGKIVKDPRILEISRNIVQKNLDVDYISPADICKICEVFHEK